MVELKACPFCGKKASFTIPVPVGRGEYSVIAVECDGCGARTCTIKVPTDSPIEVKENMIALFWNDRVAE